MPRTINPIHVTDARPTLTYNRIFRSADAAVSASPDSFEETNFHAPRHQRVPFTSDYQRIGPEIHHNNLVNNSVNGLFIRVGTEAGSSAQKLNVPDAGMMPTSSTSWPRTWPSRPNRAESESVLLRHRWL